MASKFHQPFACFFAHLQQNPQTRMIAKEKENIIIKQQEMPHGEIYIKQQQSAANYIVVKQQHHSAKETSGVPKPNQRVRKKNNNSESRKNSNVIKKYGRIILKFSKQFKALDRPNKNFEKMINFLNQKLIGKSNTNDLSDNFTTKSLSILFENGPSELISFNLKTASRLLAEKMRKQILGSKQIRDGNNLLYLNTMKCSQIRLRNPKLALRLQLPNQMKQ